MKVTILQKTPPRKYFGVQRDLRTLIKKRFDQEGISIPYPQVDVHTKP
jgi:small-conductance mechanosensitive channel